LTTGTTITPDAVTLDGAVSTNASGMPSLRLRQNVEWIERETLHRALKVSPLKRQAARLMGISPRSLSYYLAKYPAAGV
jgi:hypothetical protein